MTRYTQAMLFLLTLSTSATAYAQRAGDACSSDSMCGSLTCQQNNCLQDGKVKITLSWTTNTDLDIHLITPGGEEISPDITDSTQAEGGRLLFDQCYSDSCAMDSRTEAHPHAEHIVWEFDVPVVTGTYTVWTENFDGADAADYTVMFEKPSGEIEYGYGSVTATEGESSGTHTFTIDQDTECEKDTDGDGLCDEWETDGIDVDEDGTIDLDLKALGADPNHKDLFVEVDWMKGHSPYPLSDVVTAFANAPVSNPDGKNGITLHIQRSEEITSIGGTALTNTSKLDLSNTDTIKFGSKDHACGSEGWFGDKSDRDDANCENISKARQKVYRYGVFGHSQTGTGSSGRGELPGNDFVVTTGGWSDNDQMIETGTFMHEMGHTLNIRHGGLDNHNCKPNFLSIMSYTYQFDSFYPGRPLDYSRKALATLNEGALQEGVGIGGDSGWTTVVFGTGGAGADAAGQVQFGASADQAQDWDGDSTDTGTDIAAEISFVKVGASTVCGSTGNDTLRSHDDWSNIVYDFRQTSGYEGGLSQQDEGDREDELTEEQYEAMQQAVDSDGDGFVNGDDVCPGVSDPLPEKDLDGDKVGDACDACPEDPAPGFTNGCPVEDNASQDEPVGSTDKNDSEKDDSIGSTDNDGEKENTLLREPDGCQVAPNGTPSPMVLLLLAFLVASRRRRRDV